MLSLLKKLFGSGAEFYSFESQILDEVITRLAPEAGALLHTQIQAVNKIQRCLDYKKVNLYSIYRGKPNFDDAPHFRNTADEALLASIQLRAPDRQEKMTAEVWLVKGHLFSLIFNKQPRGFFGTKRLEEVQADIAGVKIWLDPMRPVAVADEKLIDASALTGWLREWYDQGRVSELCSPLPDSERAGYLDQIDAALPSDYLEFVMQCEGARLESGIIYGIAAARQVALPSANYYILAEFDDLGVVAVRRGEYSGQLYLLQYDDDSQEMGNVLTRAVVNIDTMRE